MISVLINWFILFGWVCFIGFSACIVLMFEERNYWMPPIYIIWSIMFFIVTSVAVYIS